MFGLARWTIVVPVLGLAATLVGKPGSAAIAVIMVLLLGGAILAAVYHAEKVAGYLGEPFDTLVLALAVTVIETSLIVSIMLSEGSGAQALARDTLISAIMITINGIVGLSLLIGAHRYYEQAYTQSGVSYGLAMLATLSVLTLVLPNFTTSERGPFYTPSQLGFVAVISLIVYATFVVAQTIRHRDDFMHGGNAHDHAPVAAGTARAAGLLLVLALIAVVLLAKALSSLIEAGVAQAGAPTAVVGIVISGLVLAPEGFAALRAARSNQLQTSLNLAIGSALATIGLTIPAVALTALVLGLDLELGLSMRGIVLLGLTLLVAMMTLGTGRTTMVQGVIHLVIFATFLFTSLVP
ncbi:MAG: ionic transporter y4hA [Alphaproteobacteria bacterium]|nr:ionic transporter y4hA [Alphaproteobacteria bacterium]